MANQRSFLSSVVCCGALVLLTFGAARGDTIYFKDGTSVDGKPKYLDKTTVLIDAGGATKTFQADEIERVDQNDNKGNPGAFSMLSGQKFEQEVVKDTGMKYEERAEVMDLMTNLSAEDGEVRAKARKKLIEMSANKPVFKFLAGYLPDAGNLSPEIMRTLVELDPKQARSIIGSRSSSLNGRTRAASLEMMAKYRDPKYTAAIAQGLVDPDLNVCTAAAHALSAAGDLRATPVLLQALKSPEARVRNASREALETLWSTDKAPVKFEKDEEWDKFWAAKAGSVKDPLDPKSILPLVDKKELGTTCEE